MNKQTQYEILFLNEMLNNNCWNGKHMNEQYVFKRVKHLPPKEKKQALKAWNKLLTEGLVLRKPSKKEFQVSLNSQKKAEIEKLII